MPYNHAHYFRMHPSFRAGINALFPGVSNCPPRLLEIMRLYREVQTESNYAQNDGFQISHV